MAHHRTFTFVTLVGLFLGGCAPPGHQGTAGDGKPAAPASGEGLSAPQLSAYCLEDIVRYLHNAADIPVYLPSQTSPIFFFENLRETARSDRQLGREMSAEYRSRFRRREITVVHTLAYREGEGVAVYDPYDPQSCQDQDVGHWVELSSVVFNPVRNAYGVFMRSAPKACMPFGGSRFWVSMSSEGESISIVIEDLAVTEF